MKTVKEALDIANIVTEYATRSPIDKVLRAGINIYGVDGRMLVRTRTDSFYECNDSEILRIVKSMDELLSPLASGNVDIGSICDDEVRNVILKFRASYRSALKIEEEEYNDRYTPCQCPSCCDTVYYDKDNDELLLEKPKYTPMREDCYLGHVVLVKDYKGKAARFNAFYIEQAMKCIPRGFWAIRDGVQEDYKNPCLLYRKSVGEGDVQVGIMPLSNIDSNYDSCLEIRKV